jgi:uncharacterized delta-60 repeat protein
MGIWGIVVRYVVIGCALFLSACGGGGGGDDGGSGTANTPAPPPPASEIGPDGGTVNGPNGTKVVVPPGALAVNTPIAITQIAASAVPLPSGITPIGATFAFTPHGTTFAVPVTVTLPFDPASVPAGSLPQFMKTNAQNQWQDIADPVFGATSVSGQVTSFSDLMTGLLLSAPRRVWEFSHIPGTHAKAVPLAPPNHGGRQPEDVPSGRSVSDIVEFGPALFDEPVTDLAASLPPDQIANGHAFGSANGVTYGVLAEAPDGELGGPDPIGSKTNLIQRQTFTVTAANPTLRVKLTKVRILLTDFNGPTGPTGGIAPIKGEVKFNLSASKGIATPFLLAKGHAHVFGADNNFFPRAANLTPSNIVGGLWNNESFNSRTGVVGFSIVNGQPTLDPLGTVAPGSCPGTFGLMELKATIPIDIPISDFKEGDVLFLRSEVTAETYNRRGGGSPLDCEGSSASAFIRDPLEIGGVEWEFTGLQPSETSAEDNFDESARLDPAVCETQPNPDPEAGTLQFEASTFTVDEFEGSIPTVAITRTGGSKGAISATFTTSDGSATAGDDYQAMNTTVFFSDGEQGVQIVPIPITPDLFAELGETVNMTLSEPAGCGALGAQTTAVMTILDNRVNTPNQPSGLDPTFDTDGKVTTNFGGDDSAMAIQPDGKIVMVGGSISDFVLARYNTNGSLDTTFGTNGLVTHNMLTGTAEEIARAVAIQSDGKIIVAGHTGQFGRPGRPAGNRFDHAVVRYNANGSVDTTFGAGGVASSLIGRIFAMALQPDGGIIVVGDAPQPEDMMVARYNPNGNLDLTFGEGGFRLFDFDLTAELADSVAVQSNGSIVLSGPHTKVGETVREQHTAVIRLDAGGDPDATFSTDGTLILDNTRVNEGVAIQSDSRIVLVGDTDGASANAPRFLTMRLNTNGTVDDSFGTEGRAVTDITTRGDTARSVALQADGKIVVAGSSNNQVNPNFAAVRYNANGTPDASFATASILSVDFFGFTDAAENVAIQGDGKIVLGGVARNNVDGYGLARVNP